MIYKESMTPEEIQNYLNILNDDYPEAHEQAKRALNQIYGVNDPEALKRGQEINEALEIFIKESWGCCNE